MSLEYLELLKIDEDIRKYSEREILERQLFHLRNLDRYARLAATTSATLTFRKGKGELKMPATIQVGQTATATYLEWSGPNGTGTQLAPTGTVSYSSDNPAV